MNLELLPIQIIFFVILLWPMSRVWLRYKDASVKLGEFLFWTSVWIAGVVAIFFPDFLSYIANLVGIGRGSDLVIYLSLALLFYLVFRTNVHIENVQHDVSKVVRELALKESKKASKNTKSS
jgi:hypothetical protein